MYEQQAGNTGGYVAGSPACMNNRQVTQEGMQSSKSGMGLISRVGTC